MANGWGGPWGGKSRGYQGQGGQGGSWRGRKSGTGNRGASGSSWRGGNGEKRGNWRGKWRGKSTNRDDPVRFEAQETSQDNPMSMPGPAPNPTPSSQVVVMKPVPKSCPYKAWTSYLPTLEYSDKGEIVKKLKAAEKYWKENDDNDKDMEELSRKRSVILDVTSLLEDRILNSNWPMFHDDLENQAELVFGIFGLAKHQLILNELNDESAKFPIIRVRLVNRKEVIPIQDLRTKDYNKLVTVTGSVIRMSSVRPICTCLAFECLECQFVQAVYQPYGRFLEPTRCPSQACRSRRFSPLRSHCNTMTVDWQVLRLQEIVQHESGRVPRTIECEISEDLCDSAMPGDVVTLSGVVKNVNMASSGFSRGNDKLMCQLYIRGLGITNQRENNKKMLDVSNSGKMGIEFTMADYTLVREIQSFESQTFKLLVHSLCPSIYGHDIVKAGLLLGLFGGSNKYLSDKTHMHVRGDPHILIVGDPGLGKSQILTSCASIAPRGVFVTGNTTTSSGLTVTLVKDSANDFSLEAGALVMADQGVCCIDEFDKMTHQHSALLEAMEQQSISIAKSCVVCTLPARTAVFAAANPVGGHYKRSKTVAENLKMNPALLSRFDLVFILIDKPNEELDGFLSDHIMKLHAKGRGNSFCSAGTNDSSSLKLSLASSSPKFENSENLQERLRKKAGENIEPVAHEFLRKYIAYARQYVFPKLNEKAGKVLRDFYIELRQRYHFGDTTPITLRQLESLVRLTEARAKVELREEATESDALDVIEIMRASMIDSMTNESGNLDFSRSHNGSGMSSRGAAKKFITALQRHADMLQKSSFTVEEMKGVLNRCGATVANFFDFLTSLNTQGYLLKRSSKIYQLLCVDY